MEQNGVTPTLNLRDAELLGRRRPRRTQDTGGTFLEALGSSAQPGLVFLLREQGAGCNSCSSATHLRQEDYPLPVRPDDVVHLGPHPLPGQLGGAQARLEQSVQIVKALQQITAQKLHGRNEKRKQLAAAAQRLWFPLGPVLSQTRETFVSHNLELFL